MMLFGRVMRVLLMRGHKARQALICVFTISLLIAAMTSHACINTIHLQEKAFLPCDLEGPTFQFSMPEFADLVPGTGAVNLSLNLDVRVSDPDGVDTVIGGYKNRSESIWRNVTLHHDPDAYWPDQYSGHAINYTLDERGWVIWDIRFYANDSLGNWNASDITFFSIARSGLPPNTTVINGQDGVDWLQPGLMVLGVVVIMVISYLAVRRRWMTSSSRALSGSGLSP
jgi:hypothetical protein